MWTETINADWLQRNQDGLESMLAQFLAIIVNEFMILFGLTQYILHKKKNVWLWTQ